MGPLMGCLAEACASRCVSVTNHPEIKKYDTSGDGQVCVDEKKEWLKAKRLPDFLYDFPTSAELADQLFHIDALSEKFRIRYESFFSQTTCNASRDNALLTNTIKMVKKTLDGYLDEIKRSQGSLVKAFNDRLAALNAEKTKNALTAERKNKLDRIIAAINKTAQDEDAQIREQAQIAVFAAAAVYNGPANLGMSLKYDNDDKVFKVASVEKKSPAAVAGIVADDVIVSLDGSSLAGSSGLDALLAPFGDCGSRVKVGWKHGDREKIGTIKRQLINLPLFDDPWAPALRSEYLNLAAANIKLFLKLPADVVSFMN